MNVKEVRLVEKLGKQRYHSDRKELFQPIKISIKDFSEDVTRTMIEISKEDNKALTSLNNTLLGIVIDRGLIASYLLSPLSQVTNPEKTNRFKFSKRF